MRTTIKIIFSLLLITSMTSCTNDNNDIITSGSSSSDEQLLNSIENGVSAAGGSIGGGVKFTIGRQSRNCHGFGICRLDKVKVGPVTWTNVPPDPAAPNQTTILETNFHVEPIEGLDHLVVDISPEILDDFIKKEGGNNFIMEEDYVLEDEVARKMGLDIGFTIYTGEYPLQKYENSKMYYIRF